MKVYGTSYLFNAKKREQIENIEFLTKKNVFDATNFMSIFSQNLEYLWEYSTDLHKFSPEWKLLILAS